MIIKLNISTNSMLALPNPLVIMQIHLLIFEASPKSFRENMIKGSAPTIHADANLMGLQPRRVILFGSYAYGEPDKDSDIDLIVVLDKHGISKSYQEKRQNRLLVGKALLDIEREVPIDTLVYTLDEWNLFLQQNSAFAKLIQQKGVILHEVGH